MNIIILAVTGLTTSLGSLRSTIATIDVLKSILLQSVGERVSVDLYWLFH